jgi:hypothetical protein
MRRIDKQFAAALPCRQLQAGAAINALDWAALCPRRRTTNQVWCADITYIPIGRARRGTADSLISCAVW